MKIILCLSLILVSQILAQTCSEYCDMFMLANCSGYTDKPNCMAICAAFPIGTVNDTGNNTIGCRLYHAGVANMSTGQDKLDHCFHASPSGGKVCGTPCQSYCSLMGFSCNATANNPFPDAAFCAAACANYDQGGDASTTAGPTVFCKIYHATVSIGDKSHCEHAAPSGANLCGSRCEMYCGISNKTCTANNKIYNTYSDCMAFCEPMTNGTVADRGNDTKDCRIYHAVAAHLDPVLHCKHASASGGDLCGKWCDVYCNLAQSACTGANKLYDTPALCQTACNGIVKTGVPGATSGDSLQCRIYHLGVASQTAALATVHCPHAAVISKDGVCGAAAPTSKTETTGNAFAIVFSTLTLLGVLLF